MIAEVSVSLVVSSLFLMLVCPVDGAKIVIPSVLSSLALLIPPQAMATALLPAVHKALGTYLPATVGTTADNWCYGCGCL